jgi:hypothetical protein
MRLRFGKAGKVQGGKRMFPGEHLQDGVWYAMRVHVRDDLYIPSMVPTLPEP